MTSTLYFLFETVLTNEDKPTEIQTYLCTVFYREQPIRNYQTYEFLKVKPTKACF